MARTKKAPAKAPYNSASLTVGNDYLDERDLDKMRKVVANPDSVELVDELNRTVRARALTQPEVLSALVIQKFDSSLDINAVAAEMRDQSAEIRNGNMGRAESMLIAQAHSLDMLFSYLTRRAHGNMGAGYLQATETYLRLALRAQNQCRSTLETLSAIKNPPVVFAKQANFATNQQVNNSVPSQPEPMAKDVSPALENETEQNELGESGYELLENARASGITGGTVQEPETVGAIHRPED